MNLWLHCTRRRPTITNLCYGNQNCDTYKTIFLSASDKIVCVLVLVSFNVEPFRKAIVAKIFFYQINNLVDSFSLSDLFFTFVNYFNFSMGSTEVETEMSLLSFFSLFLILLISMKSVSPISLVSSSPYLNTIISQPIFIFNLFFYRQSKNHWFLHVER